MKILLNLAIVLFISSQTNASVFPKTLVGVVPAPTPATGSRVLYFGGPVISSPQVVTVFWGSKVDPTLQKSMPAFYAAVVNSTYMDWLKEYDTNVNAVDGRMGTSQTIGRGSYLKTVTITPSITATTVTEDQIRAELQKQISAGVLPMNTANTLYMMHFPKGMTITIKDDTGATAASCQAFCAFHGGTKSTTGGGDIFYGVMPDLSSASCAMGCGMGLNLLGRTTVSASHELLEATTDAYPTPGSKPAYPQAWNDAQGNEVSDICQNHNGKLTAGATTFVVQQTYSNAKAGCTTDDYMSSK